MKRTIEVLATILTTLGALYTAIGGYDPINVYLLNSGSVLWTMWAILDKKYGVLVVNLNMLIIYSYGTLTRIL